MKLFYPTAKTNWTFLVVIAILTIFAGIGMLIYQSSISQTKGVGVRNPEVVEGKPLGFFLNQYENVSHVDISRIQPSDITIDGFTLVELEKKYDGTIVKWDLIIDEAFDSITDVIDNCYRVLLVNPDDEDHLLLDISFQGKKCEFWKNIESGDSLTLIGEINIQEWIVSEERPFKTKTVIEIRPMIVKRENRFYTDGTLPRALRGYLLRTLEEQ